MLMTLGKIKNTVQGCAGCGQKIINYFSLGSQAIQQTTLHPFRLPGQVKGHRSGAICPFINIEHNSYIKLNLSTTQRYLFISGTLSLLCILPSMWNEQCALFLFITSTFLVKIANKLSLQFNKSYREINIITVLDFFHANHYQITDFEWNTPVGKLIKLAEYDCRQKIVKEQKVALIKFTMGQKDKYNIINWRNKMIQEDADQEQYIFNESKAQKELEKTLQILAKVSPSNEQVKQSNRIIIEYLKQPECLKILIILLIQHQGNEAKCSIIISFITYYLKAQISTGVKTIRHQKKEIYKKVKNIFLCSTVSPKHKKMLQPSFSDFLATLSTEFIQLRRSLCNQIVGYFLESENIQNNDLSNIMYLIQVLLTPNLESQTLKLLQQNLLSNFIQLSLDLMRELKTILPQAVNAKKLLPNQLERVEWAMKVHRIATLLFTNANIDKVITLKSTLILSPSLANLCEISLHLSPNGNSYMLSEKELQGFSFINDIKVNTLNIIQDYLNLLVKAKRNLSDTKYIPVQETIRTFLKIFPALSLQLQNYPQQPVPSKQLINKTLLLLSKITQIPMFLNELTEIRDLVIFRVALPFLLPTPQDLNLNAEDYCDKREKLINFQKPTNLHQAATHLIQSFANQIYGTVPYLIKSFISLIQFQLTADPQHFDQIPNSLVQSPFYKKCTYFQQIEISLSILALLSYHADTRDDVAAEVQAMLVRRQQFFSRLDVPANLIVSFLHFCAYYLQNFYELILKGQANARFHRSLLFHALQLLHVSFNAQTRDYANNQMKKIGIQSIDYISNALIQPKIFAAIFPQWDEQTPAEFVKLIDNICLYFDSTANHSVLENVLIDFVTRRIDAHYKQQNNYQNMPKVIRNQVSLLIPTHIINNFKPTIKNDTIARQKMLQLYQLILICCADPLKVMQIGIQLLDHIIETEYSFIEQALDIVQVFLKRVVKQNMKLTPALQEITAKCALKSMKICDNEKYENEVFDVILNLNLLNVHSEEITISLLESFKQQLSDKDVDEEAELLMEKTLYLLMQIAFSNFGNVSGSVWTNVLENMLDYLRTSYKRADTITVGKATCICLCCYIRDPQGMEILLSHRLEGLWDCIIDDHHKYNSRTEKKIACIILLNFMMNYSHRPVIKDKFIHILKAVCIIMYYIYEKDQIQWKDQDSDDDDESESSSEKQQRKAWKQVLSTMRENKFLADLPDERAMLKNLCIKLNQQDHVNFQRFINDLPIGLQNLMKNKIMMYREDTSLVNKKKIRTIYKVKKQETEND